MTGHEGPFKPDDNTDLPRFSAYGELVKTHFFELIRTPNLITTYYSSLAAVTADRQDALERGLLALHPDEEDKLYLALSPEERLQLANGDRVLGVDMRADSSSKWYKIVQLDQSGNILPLTSVIICGQSPERGTYVQDDFTTDQAVVVTRLAEEREAFLRPRRAR